MRFSKSVKKILVAALFAFIVFPMFYSEPVKALPAGQGETSNELMRVKMFQEVENTYKSFSTSLFYLSKYDVTYKKLYFKNSFSLRGVTPIAYYSGTYKGWNGKITVFKCEYNVW
ncbi:hypothetical protein [uncultured Olegusella sp.]|uniref:hypothetical protein n=1 Tax=uncultured Olegusella sp. TaxID=1979846 RepID=UPI00260515E2|nr:hypothetical protein [uncultured Olegusella sp.]